ncbi:HAD hydrolase-like protein [Kribbella sp. ALI-6-A]|uniref:HAD hydrolase-like protein n=1 Tax=Kribbella sp. ALI-6-A TaxID=1933817 RepID=UPI00117AC20B|nr:HAD hydrolase-like protein [Kribbella sp. ALI-6-A]
MGRRSHPDRERGCQQGDLRAHLRVSDCSRTRESIQTDGRTDFEIIANLLTANKEDPDEFTRPAITDALMAAMKDKYDDLRRRGSVLPGAREALAAILADDSIHQSVLTGNIASNARSKLTALGLDEFIDFETGGFGSDDISRPRLVGHAQRRAQAKYKAEFDEKSTVLIGDTVRDVRAAKLGGARVIGVATGVDSPATLRAEGADMVFDDLRDTAAVVQTVKRLAGQG